MTKPRVAVSSCLLGHLVRWDGTAKPNDLVQSLDDRVELVPVCPEDEIGMGTPREPIKINRRHRLVGVRSGTDHTDAMRAFAVERLEELGEIDGWIFKARSPSCGLHTVNIEGEGPVGRGIFAEVVTSLRPDLPVAEEDQVDDTFIDRVVAHAARRTDK
jgi:uncharacterized protein YbbK (DUF523 family)